MPGAPRAAASMDDVKRGLDIKAGQVIAVALILIVLGIVTLVWPWIAPVKPGHCRAVGVPCGRTAGRALEVALGSVLLLAGAGGLALGALRRAR